MDWVELSNWTEYTKLLIGLTVIANPLSTMPLFLGLTADRSKRERIRVAIVGAVAFAATLLIFAYFGKAFLDVFGISLAAFRIAGGVLLLSTALEMFRSEIGAKQYDTTHVERIAVAGVVPIAIPSLAGPGTISTVIIYASAHQSVEHIILVTLVILTSALLVYLLLHLTLSMGSLFGRNATLIMSRVMGLVVASIAIEFIIHGVAEHFPDLTILH